MTTDFRTTAETIAYALGEPPKSTEWALGYIFPALTPDGAKEIVYHPARGESDARTEADETNLSIMSGGRHELSHPLRAFPAFRETRVLPDGTRIISPWTEATEEN